MNAQHYAPIEGEVLADAWQLEDSKFFTLGCDDLMLATDYKPLFKKFGDYCLDEITNTRIFCLKQPTLSQKFKIIYVPGQKTLASDTTSHKPTASTLNQTQQEWLQDIHYDQVYTIHDKIVVEIFSNILSFLNKLCAVTWDRVQKATVNNENLQMLKSFIINGFPDKPDELFDGCSKIYSVLGT